METFIVSPTDEAQEAALKHFLEADHIPYEIEPDATEHLLSTEANRKRLDDALEAYQKGNGSNCISLSSSFNTSW